MYQGARGARVMHTSSSSHLERRSWMNPIVSNEMCRTSIGIYLLVKSQDIYAVVVDDVAVIFIRICPTPWSVSAASLEVEVPT